MNLRSSTIVTLAAIAGLTGCATDQGQAPSDARNVVVLPTPDATSKPPWQTPADVLAHAKAAGLDLGPMGTAEHYHPSLRIIIDGEEVSVSPNIGVDPATGAMSALHTHDGDGTIHIEADSVGEQFTLGQLFTQWGVALSPEQIGGVEAEPGSKVDVTSNGAKFDGDPADLSLEPDQEIVLSLN
ncbi:MULTISPECIES: hypothetical protein [unclassified Aeromicrobium]|uniref:hypothetical protein n=1 Tax=unclassified Aeromicrobium TaxID=2633570 RepID=UPI0025799D91|nr:MULTISPECIES: hypothetical protein [unclassified Aeromicrobium]